MQRFFSSQKYHLVILANFISSKINVDSTGRNAFNYIQTSVLLFSRPCHLSSKLKSETLTLMMIRRWLLIQNIDIMTSLQYLFIYLFPGDKCLLKVLEVGTGHWRAFPASNYMFVVNNHLNLLKFNNEETRTLSTDIMFFNVNFVYV